MVKSLKNQWIEELESDRHVQGTGALSRNGKECCLGVLANLIEAPCGSSLFGLLWKLDGKTASGGMLPLSILPDAVQIKLTDMNDSGKTFKQIADYLKKHPEIRVRRPKKVNV